ncbi:type II toxin-antitoxin system HigB family toxin [Thermodesulfobacteriota bacterium]
MRIISRAMLSDYWTKHPETEASLKVCETKTKRAVWNKGQDVLDDYPKASLIGDDRVYFRLGPSRLIVKINYRAEVVFTRWVGPRKEVQKIDTSSI